MFCRLTCDNSGVTLWCTGDIFLFRSYVLCSPTFKCIRIYLKMSLSMQKSNNALWIQLALGQLLLMASSTHAAKFKSRNGAKALSDLGPMNHLSPKERAFVKTGIGNGLLVESLPIPSDDDWLSEHHETFQNLSQWRAKFDNYVSKERQSNKVIYLVPLDERISNACVDTDGKGKTVTFIHLLESYAKAFFSDFIVKILDMKATQLDFKSRVHFGKKQFLIPDICQFLEKKFPKDAYCIVGITVTDLYPRESWNFVFGQAHPRSGIGVFSFARYDPSFDLDADSELELGNAHASVSPSDQVVDYLSTLVLWRSCKVMVHEICHLFCLNHCIYFSCAMNGSNHLEEATRRPMFLCPVCLVKLRSVCKHTSLKDRYIAMMNVLGQINDVDFIAAVKWIEKAIEAL